MLVRSRCHQPYQRLNACAGTPNPGQDIVTMSGVHGRSNCQHNRMQSSAATSRLTLTPPGLA